MPRALRITLVFPGGIYSGSQLGAPEDLPAPSRIFEAFVAAAAGGPYANRKERVLVADESDREAVRWLEETEPIGIVPPPLRANSYSARRYRWRASPVDPADTSFEPRVALGGPIEILWPEPPEDVLRSLRRLAPEVTHIGRAECNVIVSVDSVELDDHEPTLLRLAAGGRGPGLVMRIPTSGRFAALERAYAEATKPGPHGTGSLGKQAPDHIVTGDNHESTRLVRFTADTYESWPYDEVIELEIEGEPPAALGAPENRVQAAVGVHRALVRAIGENVPQFVTGRDGDGPLRGPGHLAIQFTRPPGADQLRVALAVPRHVPDADRLQLLDALERPLRIGFRDTDGTPHRFTATHLRHVSAQPYWPAGNSILTSEVPVCLEATGGPRSGGWTLDDSLACSVGYALRGVLEEQGVQWGTGWSFRQELAQRLREEYGVVVRARRVRRLASHFAHKVSPGTLLVAVHAFVSLGELDSAGTGFLALGRARHLGGGLLRPLGGDS